MIQTIKIKKNLAVIKNKFFEKKIQSTQKLTNFRKPNKIRQIFKVIRKNVRTKSYLLRNKKSVHNFLKLIANANKDLQPKIAFKHNPMKLPVKIFLNKMHIRFDNKVNGTETKIKTLSKNLYLRQKHLRFLRHERKSKLAPSFYEPWKNIKLAPTKKQQWLNSAYVKYKYLRFKDRIDFFRGYLGQIILLTELHSSADYKATWFSRYYFLWKNRHLKEDQPELFKQLNNDYFATELSMQKVRSKILLLQKQGWWYENLVQKKKLPKSIKKFILERPHTAFQIHWKQQKREPWKNALLFKRAVYSGFGEYLRKENKFRIVKIKPYLRRKNPRYEKRNRIYHKITLLLANRRQKFRIKANKVARIKQVAGKVLFPFYGNLRLRQRRQIIKKNRIIKSKRLSSNELILSRFESRLDVVIYRLNLAPTILWARRLILDGSIFVSPQSLYQSEIKWSTMYSSLRKFAFPLKLRDPKGLYIATLLKDLPHHWGTFKFLSYPQTNISYLLQPGDLIQCSLDNSLNQFKTTSFLWQKPAASHLLNAKKKKFLWEWLAQKYVGKNSLTWEQTSEKVNAAVFLRTPSFTDLHSTDRVKESFLRWAVL